MNKTISISNIIKSLKTNPFILNSGITMEYSEGIPVLGIKNGYLTLIVPYLKYKITGEVDKTLVYPVRYVVEISLPDQRIVRYEELTTNPAFEIIDFNQPIGLFRHKAIQHLDKKEYMEQRDSLYEQYDKVVASLLYDEPYSDVDDMQLHHLLNMLLEPSLRPIYQVLDQDFYNKYLKND